MFINSLQTHAPQKMFLGLCFPMQKSDVLNIRKLSKIADCGLWPFLGRHSVRRNQRFSPKFSVFNFELN